MAVQNICGFETGDTLEALTSGGTIAIGTTYARSGRYGLRTNPTTTGVGWYDLGSSSVTEMNLASLYGRFYFRYATLPASGTEEIASVWETTTDTLKLGIRIDSTGSLSLWDSLGLQISTTGATDLAANTWYRIEVRADTGVAATAEVKVNGTVEVTGTGNLTTANARSLRLGKSTDRSNQTVDFWYDDISVDNSAYPGAGACGIMLPNGAGNYALWTGGTFVNLDEIPQSTTDYITSTGVVGEASTFAMHSTGSSGISGTINAVKPTAIVQRAGGTNGSLLLRTRYSGSDSDSGARTAAMTWVARGSIQTAAPGGGGWSTSVLDAIECGVVENTTVNLTRADVVAIMVDASSVALLGPGGFGSWWW